MDLEVLSAGSESTDDSIAINAAATTLGGAGAGPHTLSLPSPHYFCQTPALFWSNTNVVGEDGWIHRRITSGADINATFRNKNPIAGGDQNISVRNLKFGTDSVSFPGKHIVFEQVDGVTIEDVEFGEVFNNDSWLIFLRNVDNFAVRRMSGTAGDFLSQAGIQIGGCRHGVIEDIGPLEVGDDVIALVNELYPDGHSVLREMFDIEVSNCTNLYTYGANILKIVVGPACAASIHDITVNNVEGASDGEGINVYDQNFDQLIYNLTLEDIECDCSGNIAPGLQVKGVRDSTFRNVWVSQPRQRTEIDGVARCRFYNHKTLSPRDANNQCVLVGNAEDCEDVTFDGGQLTGGTWGLWLGETGVVTRWTVKNMAISDCTNQGIVISNAFDGVVRSTVRVTGCGDKAVEEFAPSDRNIVYDNGLTGQDDPADDGAFMIGAESEIRTLASSQVSSGALGMVLPTVFSATELPLLLTGGA